MSLKSIELQVALPRTIEAGRIQDQLTQKSNHDQQQLALMNQSEQELNRTRSTPLIATHEYLGLHQNSKREQSPKERQKAQKDKRNVQAPKNAEHPYSGKHIDLSL